jgi:hypothetical protein
LLDDFGSARRSILFTVSAKLGHWQQLPWILCGVAHADERVARHCGRQALQIYAGLGDTHRHHWISMLCLTPGFPVAEQLRELEEDLAPDK